MGRPKGSKNKPKPIVGNPIETPLAPPAPVEAPKHRGRKPGSKNKPKEGVPPRPDDDPDDPPHVKAYTPEELAKVYEGTKLATAPAVAPPVTPPAPPVAETAPAKSPDKIPDKIPDKVPEEIIVKHKKAIAGTKYSPFLEFVEWLDTQMSDQWRFHYDMLGIKEGRNRKQAILYFIGSSFGFNTGLLEEMGKTLKTKSNG